MTEQQKTNVIEKAKSYLGTIYEYGAGASETQNAVDCSLLTQLAMKAAGIEIGRSSILQAADAKGKEIEMNENLSNLEKGDLIFFRSDRGFYYDELFGGRKISVGHVALFLGNGEIIHSRKAKGGVCIENLSEVTKNPNYAIVMVKRF
jgi:cell wall-associated NlpC family hydrolase